MKITILLVHDSLVGGNRVIAIYAKKLFERGHDVEVVIPKQPRPNFKDWARHLIKERSILRSSQSSTVSFFRDASFKVRWLDRCGPVYDRDVRDSDVVIATWWKTIEWVWDLNARKGKKLHFMQDYENWGSDDPAYLRRVDQAYALPIPKIVIANWEKALLQEKWGVEPLDVIPNSVDTSQFNSPVRGKQDFPTVGFTYSNFENKGSDVVLESVDRARLAVPNLHVVSFGSTSPNIAFPDYISFTPALAERYLPLVYGSCDAWLFGTRKEGFGLPILEAMACRTPVIGTPAGAGADLINKGGGILVSINDPLGMSEAIIEVARMSDSRWRSMSDRAYAVATSYSWDDAADRFEEAVKSVAYAQLA